MRETKEMILVVEDVQEISSEMNAMLHARGHNVMSAVDAEQAIKIAEEQRPKLILTDLDLPTLGLLVRLIREHKDLKDTLVAIIDINGPDVNKEDGLKVLTNFGQLDELLQSIQ